MTFEVRHGLTLRSISLTTSIFWSSKSPPLGLPFQPSGPQKEAPKRILGLSTTLSLQLKTSHSQSSVSFKISTVEDIGTRAILLDNLCNPQSVLQYDSARLRTYR